MSKYESKLRPSISEVIERLDRKTEELSSCGGSSPPSTEAAVDTQYLYDGTYPTEIDSIDRDSLAKDSADEYGVESTYDLNSAESAFMYSTIYDYDSE